jgi:hypothetical protein
VSLFVSMIGGARLPQVRFGLVGVAFLCSCCVLHLFSAAVSLHLIFNHVFVAIFVLVVVCVDVRSLQRGGQFSQSAKM